MAQTKEIPQAYSPTKEIPQYKLEDLLKSLGIPTPSQEALQYPSATDEFIDRYIYEPLQKSKPDIALSARNAAKVAAFLLPFGFMGRGGGEAAEAAEQAPVTFESALQEATAPRSPLTTPLESRGGAVPNYADFMGPTRRLRWNEYPPELRPEPRDTNDWGSLNDFIDPDPGRSYRSTLTEGQEPWPAAPHPGDPFLAPPRPPFTGDFGQAPPYAERPSVANPQPFRRGRSQDYSLSYMLDTLDRGRGQEAAPVRSLPPYDEYNHYAGRHPTTRMGDRLWRRTRNLSYDEGHPTGMLDKPSPLEWGERVAAPMGEKYANDAAAGIPLEMRRPGLVMHENKSGDISLAYFGPDGKPLAGAIATRGSGERGIYVHGFGANMSRGIAGKRAAVEVGQALYRMLPRGGSMSEFSRGLFGRIAEAANNPKLRNAYFKTRLLDPKDVSFR